LSASCLARWSSLVLKKATKETNFETKSENFKIIVSEIRNNKSMIATMRSRNILKTIRQTLKSSSWYYTYTLKLSPQIRFKITLDLLLLLYKFDFERHYWSCLLNSSSKIECSRSILTILKRLTSTHCDKYLASFLSLKTHLSR